MIKSKHDGNARLVIDHVTVPGGGRIGMVHCPGRNHRDRNGHRWTRDLAADLQTIKDWPASALLSLIEEHEFARLGVPDLGNSARAIGLAWHHLPIHDLQSPDTRFEAAWQKVSGTVDGILARDENLVLHCAAGLGRTGTMAARILVERGFPMAQAIEAVRAARPGTIETATQMDYLARL